MIYPSRAFIKKNQQSVKTYFIKYFTQILRDVAWLDDVNSVLECLLNISFLLCSKRLDLTASPVRYKHMGHPFGLIKGRAGPNARYRCPWVGVFRNLRIISMPLCHGRFLRFFCLRPLCGISQLRGRCPKRQPSPSWAKALCFVASFGQQCLLFLFPKPDGRSHHGVL